MPLLAQLLANLLGSLGGNLANRAISKTAVALAATAAFTAALAALVAAFNGWIAPLVAQAFNTQYGQFIGLAFPPIAGSCLATLASAFLAIQVYKLGQRIATVSASA